MKILLLGGTGAMGTHLCEILSSSDHLVFVTTRRKRINKNNISFIVGNALDDKFIDKILNHEKWDVIIDFMVYTTPEFKGRIDKLLSATKQYVFLSSARVYANSSKRINEQSCRLLDICIDNDYLETDEYALAKARQEDMLFDSFKKNYTIIRPYITFSENRLQLGVFEKEEWLFRALQGKSIVISHAILEKKTTLSYGYDVAKGISSVIGDERYHSQIFNTTLGQELKWKDVLAIYLDFIEMYTGKRPNVFLCNESEFLSLKYNKAQIKYDRMYDRVFDNSKLENELKGYESSCLKDRLTNCLSEFLKTKEFGDIAWSLEGKKDKYSGEYSNIFFIKGTINKIKYFVHRIGLK